MKCQIPGNVEKLGAPFFKVITAEETGAYKPRMQGFEVMLDMLGCGPEDITHVSSSFRYDLMTAYDLGIKSKVSELRARAGKPVLRVYRDPRHLRPARRLRALSHDLPFLLA